GARPGSCPKTGAHRFELGVARATPEAPQGGARGAERLGVGTARPEDRHRTRQPSERGAEPFASHGLASSTVWLTQMTVVPLFGSRRTAMSLPLRRSISAWFGDCHARLRLARRSPDGDGFWVDGACTEVPSQNTTLP